MTVLSEADQAENKDRLPRAEVNPERPTLQAIRTKATEVYGQARDLLDRAYTLVGGTPERQGEQYKPAELNEAQQRVVDTEVASALRYLAKDLDGEEDDTKIRDHVGEVKLFGSSVYSEGGNHFRTRTDNPENPSDVDMLVILSMEEQAFTDLIKRRGVERGFSWGVAEGITRAFIKLPSETGQVDSTEVKFVTQLSAKKLIDGTVRPKEDGNVTLLSALKNGRKWDYP